MGANPDTDTSKSQQTENNNQNNNSNHSASAQTNRDSSNSSSSPTSAGNVNIAKRSVKPASSPNTSSNINSSVPSDESSQDMLATKNSNSIASKTVTTTNKQPDSIGGQERQQISQPPQRKNQHASNDNSDSSAKQNFGPPKQLGKVLDQQGSVANASTNMNTPSDQAVSGPQGVHSVTSIRKNREGYPKTTFVMDAGTHGVGRSKEPGSGAEVEQPTFGVRGSHRMRKPNPSMEYASAAFSSPLDGNNTFNGHANKSRDSSTGNVVSKEQHKHNVRNMNMRSENNSHQSNFYQQHGKSAPHQYQQHYNNRAHSHQQHSNQYHNYSHQSSNHHNQQEQLSRTNLYIKGLSADTNDNDLFALCSQFGNIVSTKAILDKATNKCKGYGFVDFETAEAAEFAVNELQKQGILAHMARQQEADPTNLYIANLPQVMTESELENLLRPYGPVVSTRILVNQHRQPRGVGFARMETKEQCDMIIASLNGAPIKDSEEPLLIKFADGAGKKRSHQYQHRPLGSNVFVGDNLWRNSNNETNSYSVMNSGAGNRNFHSGSFDHARQNHHPTFSQNNETMIKQHQHMISTMAGFQQHQGNGGQPQHHQMHSMVHHVAGPNSTGSGGHQSAQHQSPMTHHHGPNQPSHSSNHRNQNQSSPYAGGSNFTISAQQIGNSNDGSQWLHTSQAHQPYVIQPQILAPTTAMDPSMHYMNLANQMQGLQIGNPAVGGFLSPQQWQVWPGTVAGKHSGPTNNTNPGGNHSGYSDVD